MTAWSVHVYHDEPQEAAVDAKPLDDYWWNRAEAIDAARSHMDDYWNAATIHRGSVVTEEVEPGIKQQRFVEADPPESWGVGPDWVDRYA